MNLVSLLLGHAASRPDAPALVQEGRTVSFGALAAMAAAAAGGLGRMGVGPGDRVALVGPNDEAFVAAYLGVLWAGAVAVPLNPHAPARELERQLGTVEPRVVLTGAGTEDLRPRIGGLRIEALPPGPAVAAEAERDDDDLAVLLFTSGTAGAPRAAMLTHANLAANIGQVLDEPGLRVDEHDVGLAALPFFHVFGLNVALGVGLAAGMTTVLLDTFEPRRAVELIRRHRVSVFAGVPTMYAAILELDEAEAPHDALATVRLAVSGAAELPVERAEAMRDRFGVVVCEGYGLTEAAPIVTSNAVGGERGFGTIGRPLPGVEVRLVGAGGDDVVVGDPGEIWVRGPNVFPGYWRDPEATGRVLTDGWLRTGDVAVADDTGVLRLVDRSKDLVIVSGFNVFPAEVEEVLLVLPGVVDAAVTGIPNPRTGEAVAAWVVPEPGVTLDPEAVKAGVARSLARYKVPSVVEVVAALPRNEAGKLIRRELRHAGP